MRKAIRKELAAGRRFDFFWALLYNVRIYPKVELFVHKIMLFGCFSTVYFLPFTTIYHYFKCIRSFSLSSNVHCCFSTVYFLLFTKIYHYFKCIRSFSLSSNVHCCFSTVYFLLFTKIYHYFKCIRSFSLSSNVH